MEPDVTIAIPIRKRLGDRWVTVDWRFAIMRPEMRLKPSQRHSPNACPAYTLRRFIRERMQRVRYGSSTDYHRVSVDKTRRKLKGDARCVWR
jgi:hypothetical protein